MSAECITVAAISSAATAIVGWLSRKFIIKTCIHHDHLLDALRGKGLDLNHNAMDKYAKENYQRIEELGHGTSGTVYKVKTKEGQIAAMKVMSMDEDMNDLDALTTEIACLRKLRHTNIVNMIETFQSDKTVWIVMELAEGGELYQKIMEVKHFSEKVGSQYIREVLRAVHYIHSNGIVHRDLKPENILLDHKDDNAHTKVADFGLAVELGMEGYDPRKSEKMKASKSVSGGFCGSPICMAPEVAQRDAQYGPQCDVWSIGCITHELLSGKPAFNASTAKELFKTIRSGAKPSFNQKVWTTISAEAKHFVDNMLQRDPVARPSANEALQDKWFETSTDHHLGDVHQEHIIRQSTKQLNQKAGKKKDEFEATLSGQPHIIDLYHINS